MSWLWCKIHVRPFWACCILHAFKSLDNRRFFTTFRRIFPRTAALYHFCLGLSGVPPLRPAPGTIFSLSPLNEKAFEAITNPCNFRLVSYLEDGMTLGLNLGPGPSVTDDPRALAGFGEDGDVQTWCHWIESIHCCFYMNPRTKVIMFRDESVSRTGVVLGGNSTPFQKGSRRQVVIQEGLNTEIGMVGMDGKLARFRLNWHKSTSHTPILNADGIVERARVVDGDKVTRPCRDGVKITGRTALPLRYLMGKHLQSGSYGMVSRAVNVDTGMLVAVKDQKVPKSFMDKAQMEVHLLSTLNHAHIIDFVASHGDDPKLGKETSALTILMGLKDGDCFELALRGTFTCEMANAVLFQMLQALDYLVLNDVIHRDVKPDNILYTKDSRGEYTFQLADFGLASCAGEAHDRVGTDFYLAPEVTEGFESTDKVDVWSLYVTMAWLFNVDGFRLMEQRNAHNGERIEMDMAIRRIVRVNDERVCKFYKMAEINPVNRASAADILRDHFNGKGLAALLEARQG